jgi:hypothetical protein
MKKIFQKTMIILFSLSLFVACKKTDVLTKPTEEATAANFSGKNPHTEVMTRVKTKTQSGIVRNYTYDATGRQLENSGTTIVNYEYLNATQVRQIDFPYDTTFYTLNNLGLAAASSQNNHTDTYTYNNKKQLVNHTTTYANTVISNEYTYVAGNIDTWKQYFDGTLYYVFTYAYFQNKTNGLDNEVFGESFRGVGSKNLLRSKTVTVPSIPGVSSIESFEYEFDVQGRVSKSTKTLNGVADPAIFYTYN